MLREELQAQSLQTLHFHRNRFIRSAHLMSELEQQRGDAAHPAASHADEMNAVMLAREKSRQTELSRHGFHAAAAGNFSTPSTPAAAGRLLQKLAPLSRHPSHTP